MILRELSPQLQIPWNMPFQLDDPPIVPTTVGKMMELRYADPIIPMHMLSKVGHG